MSLNLSNLQKMGLKLKQFPDWFGMEEKKSAKFKKRMRVCVKAQKKVLPSGGCHRS